MDIRERARLALERLNCDFDGDLGPIESAELELAIQTEKEMATEDLPRFDNGNY